MQAHLHICAKPLNVISSLRWLERQGTSSNIIADLVHKGLLYEAIQKGANDPVIRNLLRTFDQIIQHRLEEATQPLKGALRQNQLFTATLFLTIIAKIGYP